MRENTGPECRVIVTHQHVRAKNYMRSNGLDPRRTVIVNTDVGDSAQRVMGMTLEADEVVWLVGWSLGRYAEMVDNLITARIASRQGS